MGEVPATHESKYSCENTHTHAHTSIVDWHTSLSTLALGRVQECLQLIGTSLFFLPLAKHKSVFLVKVETTPFSQQGKPRYQVSSWHLEWGVGNQTGAYTAITLVCLWGRRSCCWVQSPPRKQQNKGASPYLSQSWAFVNRWEKHTTT